MRIARRILSACLFLPTIIPAAPEATAFDTPLLRASFSSEPAYVERIVVVPEPGDRPPASKSKWQRFEEALGPGRSARRTVTSHRNNDSTRTECYSPCDNQCCTHSGVFNLYGAGFGSK